MDEPSDLFDPRLAARQTDVDTSHDAAESMVSAAGRHHSLIMEVLRAGGLWSAQEIANVSEINYIAVNRRLPELTRAGLIERTDEKHKNRSGRMAYKYRLVDG
jgi:predicted ArsR family transcriptional regulator